jgi:hypothetical protein
VRKEAGAGGHIREVAVRIREAAVRIAAAVGSVAVLVHAGQIVLERPAAGAVQQAVQLGA